MEITVSQRGLDEFISSLLNRYNIFGPSKIDDGETLTKIDSPKILKLDSRNFKMSPKGFFFPQCETMLTFDLAKGLVLDRSQTPEEKEKIIIGLRPCDGLALSFFDLVFSADGFQDPYYLKKRNSTTIISLACLKPEPTCFCNAVACDVAGESGADLILFPLHQRYLIKAITKKGKDLLKYTTESRAATADELKEKGHRINRSRDRLATKLDTKRLEQRLDDFELPFWHTVHQRCLGCGICTYFCPTCYCFDITDEVWNKTGRRIRTWDSCMFSLFTLHASGHNPRPSRKERFRQRIMHKFNYAPKNFEKIFCVGCGRCIINCPVNLDIRKIVKEITEAE